MTPTGAKAWRLMGDAFVRLLRSDRAMQGPLWREAYAVADWLNSHMLTADQQHEFMTQTGWIMDAKLADQLSVAPTAAATQAPPGL
jgi:hypothetical protein